MRVLIIPRAMTLDLGYRKVSIKAGSRPYPDEIGDHPKMAQFREPDPEPAAPDDAGDQS